MLSEEDRKITIEFQKRLSEVISILDLRIFGSRARGDAVSDSDLDIFIVVETCSPKLRQKIDEIAWEVGFERDRIISTIVVTREQLESGPLKASPFMHNVQRDGVQV
jgi:predicted nucleotidyltransferase